jgi:hypothetical protein
MSSAIRCGAVGGGIYYCGLDRAHDGPHRASGANVIWEATVRDMEQARAAFRQAFNEDACAALVAAARRGVADTERLDWLRDNPTSLVCVKPNASPSGTPEWCVWPRRDDMPPVQSPEIREAIDAARAQPSTEDR